MIRAVLRPISLQRMNEGVCVMHIGCISTMKTRQNGKQTAVTNIIHKQRMV